MWICIQYENRTDNDTFNEETFEGPTTVPRGFEKFESFERAESYYKNAKAAQMWVGRRYYWSFPCDVDEEALVKLILDITKYKDI